MRQLPRGSIGPIGGIGEFDAEVEESTLIKRNGPPVNIVGGYKFHDAPEIEFSSTPETRIQSPPPARSDDDTGIPNTS